MRLIDADAYQFPGDLIYEPTIDAVEVVRCWDCKFSIGRLLDDDENDVNTWCNRWDNCVPACGYCHCGAKMDVEVER